MTRNQIIRIMRILVGLQPIVALALFSQCLNASAGECNAPQSGQGSFVGVYAEWSNLSEAQAKQYDQTLLDNLVNNIDSSDTLLFCTVSKSVFPALSTTNLFEFNSVRQMLNDTSELQREESFLAKLQRFRIKYLVFVKAEPGSIARFDAVRIDKSRVYPKEGFAQGSVQPFDQRSTDTFFDKVTEGIRKISAGTAPPRYPVIVTCFVDKIGDAAPREWKMDELTTVIPKKLVFRLAKEKTYFDFGNLFPVSFQSKCPLGPTDLANYRQMYDEHWFAWTGTLSLRGNKINIVIDFIHDINRMAMPGNTEWGRAASAVDVYAMDNEESFIKAVIDGWENYLKAVRARRIDLPPVEVESQ
jgi:hypothetical protein